MGCAGGEEVVVLDGANATKVVGDTIILQRERASIQSSTDPCCLSYSYCTTSTATRRYKSNIYKGRVFRGYVARKSV